MQSIDIREYLDIAVRRKWWIIIFFLLSCLGGLTYLMVADRVYEAETLILVQSPRVPQDYVRSIISTSAEDRLRTITQQVTSRTNLERIIADYNLYKGPAFEGLLLDQKVKVLREKIQIQISRGGSGGSSFSISFRGRDPEKVMQVTNTLASRFITENLRIRESQALGTSSFLSDELESVEKRLMDKEEELKKYREKYLGGLPEQLDTNLSILERLQQQLEQLNSNLRDAENRKMLIQQELSAEKRRMAQSGTFMRTEEDEAGSIVALKNQLAALEAKYTQQHPDVIRLRRMIEKIEGTEGEEGSSLSDAEPVLSQAAQGLTSQLNNINLTITNFRDEISKTKSLIEEYQTKVENTPKREQELLSLKRDYSNLQELYNSLLARKLEAEIAVSMEKKQKGEQFRVIDPAKVPERPVSPNAKKILLMSIVLGLGLGGGAAFLLETIATSYKTPEGAEKDLQLPVLVTLPFQRTKEEIRKVKRNNILAYGATAILFILSAIGIVVAAKGWDKTIDFMRSFFIGPQ